MSLRPAFALCTVALLVSAAAACSSGGPDSSNGGGGGTGNGGAGGAVPSIPMATSKLARVAVSAVSKENRQAAVDANNGFAVDLYGRLRENASETNLLTSPLSASLALSMAAAGARGKTASEMAAALHFGGAADAIFEGQNALSQTLDGRATAAWKADTRRTYGDPAPARVDYQLQVVNSVWGEKTFKWKAPFLDILAKDYGTGVFLEDFFGQPEATRVEINKWVSAKTADKIDELLPKGSLNDARMVLVNAIHLRLPWLTPFEASATFSDEFTTAGGSKVHPRFMHQTASLPYLDDGEAQVVALPLAGGDLSVIIALPHGSLADYEAALTSGSAALAQPTDYSGVRLSVPKVSFGSAFSLAPALKAMGMKTAFVLGSADFSGQTSGSLSILDVLQQTVIAMEETGVEAAAATAVIEGGEGGGPQGGPVEMDVNRPYLFAIVDAPTGAILFLGHVADPTLQ